MSERPLPTTGPRQLALADRPIATVIGPTENALRSLLSHVLAATPINDYDEWVALNYTASRQTTVVLTLASALKIEINDVIAKKIESLK